MKAYFEDYMVAVYLQHYLAAVIGLDKDSLGTSLFHPLLGNFTFLKI